MAGETVWRIKDWDRSYENSESRKLRKLSRVYCPNSFETRGFRHLCVLPDDVKVPVMAAFKLIQAVASKCDPRGSLVAPDGTPYTSTDIAIITGFPKRIFDLAFETLSDPGLGIMWMESLVSVAKNREILPTLREVPGSSGLEGKGREGKGNRYRQKENNTQRSAFLSALHKSLRLAPHEASRQDPALLAVFRECSADAEPTETIRRVIELACKAAEAQSEGRVRSAVKVWQANVKKFFADRRKA